MYMRRNCIQALICSIAACSLVSFGCAEEQGGTGQPVAAAETARAAPQTDEDKTLYTVGFLTGRALQKFEFTEDEFETVARGLADSALGHEAPFDPAEFTDRVRALFGERKANAKPREEDEASKFLAAAAAAEGAVRSESGLIMTERVAGKGDRPGPTDTVSVHYHGTLRDGTVFDSSVERGSPAQFPLNRVIPCWTEALQNMAVGGKSRLVCPAEIAYGSRGSGRIPGNAAILFEVELLDIVR